MKRTTIVISKKVNVPRVNAFKAAAIVTQDSEPTAAVTKKIANYRRRRLLGQQLRDSLIRP